MLLSSNFFYIYLRERGGDLVFCSFGSLNRLIELGSGVKGIEFGLVVSNEVGNEVW